VLKTIEDGEMTGDLARLSDPAPESVLDSWDFLDAVYRRMVV
jgi:isocitrate dehydrogenase